MGTTFVRVGGCGFWMRDGILELWLRLLALHLEDPVESGTIATQIRDQWLIASRGYCSGCVPVGLDEAVSTAEGARLVRTAIESLLADLATAPKTIGPAAFNLMGMTGTFVDDIETARLSEVGRAFLDLIDGKITAGPADSAVMPGG